MKDWGELMSSFRTLILIAAILITAAVAPATAAQRCFPETGQCLNDRFEQYWAANGGLDVFGYPVTAAGFQPSGDAIYLTQWLERNRFELHPENAAPFDVLLGRLGDDRLRQLDRDWQSAPKVDPSTPHYFAATGHAIAAQFWEYWRGHGLELGDAGVSERESLSLFGVPISSAAAETNASGATVLTQWFERARFEYYPDNPPAFQVQLGLLGSEVRSAANPPFETLPRMPDGLPQAEVVAVIDGDTVDVRLNGTVERLRMIGIDTPETVDPNRPVECFGREASAHARELLGGKTVRLEEDPSQDSRDRYGRALRYVWLPDDRLFNLEMLAGGFANEYTYQMPYKYQALFRAAQDAARAQQLGLWSPATCNGNSDQPAPAPRPSPPPQPPPPGGSCDPSYPDVCIPPPPPDLDCGDIPYRNFRVLPPDPHRLDGRDGDGIGCEE